MKTMTVVQFANWLNVISSDMTEAKGGFTADEDRTLNVRLYNLAMWVLEQGEKRGALNMRIRDFMARCPATVRDAARALVRESQEQLKALRAKPAAAPQKLPSALKRVKRSAKRQAELDKRYAEQQRDTELLARMDLGDAIAYIREM